MNAPTRQEMFEARAWQQLRAALFRHDLERSTDSWLERQHARNAWKSAFAFLVDEEQAT